MSYELSKQGVSWIISYQVIKMSHEDNLYYELIGDFVTFVIIKIFTNHIMEFIYQLSGHMSENFCLSMSVIGQAIDFVYTFYIFDLVFVR